MARTVVAFSVYVLGVMLAISAAAKVPAEGHKWPDTMPLFAVGIAVCLAGLVWWRHAVKREASQADGGGEGLQAMFAQVRSARREVAEIADRWNALDGDWIRSRLDRLTLDYIDPFVENRDQLIRRYGMRQGAELILAMATAERHLNRVWSAAADGCLPEARLALQSAESALDELIASIESR